MTFLAAPPKKSATKFLIGELKSSGPKAGSLTPVLYYISKQEATITRFSNHIVYYI